MLLFVFLGESPLDFLLSYECMSPGLGLAFSIDFLPKKLGSNSRFRIRGLLVFSCLFPFRSHCNGIFGVLFSRFRAFFPLDPRFSPFLFFSGGRSMFPFPFWTSSGSVFSPRKVFLSDSVVDFSCLGIGNFFEESVPDGVPGTSPFIPLRREDVRFVPFFPSFPDIESVVLLSMSRDFAHFPFAVSCARFFLP